MDDKTSGIIEQCLYIEKVTRKYATHFALCNSGRIRYLINLSKLGKKKLCKNLSSYSTKLSLLVKLMPFIPFCILKLCKLGYFVSIDLNANIRQLLQKPSSDCWNVIIGTYDDKQKLVIQDYSGGRNKDTFIKIGNASTEREMHNEISFLNNKGNFKTFITPRLLNNCVLDKEGLTIQLTEEFFGSEVPLSLDDKIYSICNEISGIHRDQIEDDGLAFSHGDFAPWNIKNDGGNYIIFDWEHCGFRIKGFDIMHYMTMIELVINNKDFNSAVESAYEIITTYDPEFKIDLSSFRNEMVRLRPEVICRGGKK